MFSLPASVLATIERLNIAGNQFTGVDSTILDTVPLNLVWCRADDTFTCPIPDWMKTRCGASCFGS